MKKKCLVKAYLFSHGSDLVPVSGQELPDLPQLLRAVLDVPDLVVKVPARGEQNVRVLFTETGWKFGSITQVMGLSQA